MLLRLLLGMVIGATAVVLVGDKIGLSHLLAPIATIPTPMILFIALNALVLVMISVSEHSRRL